MHHFFVTPGQITGNRIQITGPDVNHGKQVLRLREKEEVLISDGTGQDYLCRVSSFGRDSIFLEIIEKQDENRELPAEIVLYQGLPKSDKMELIIQKAVELGAARIVPVATEYTVVKLEPKKEEAKRKRWQAIAESAAKQSKRSRIPEVCGVLTFSQALEEAAGCGAVLFAYEHEEGMAGTQNALSKVLPGGKIAVFVGPEGGFGAREAEEARQAGFSMVSLGRRILRTETAGIALLSLLMIKLETDGQKKPATGE